MTALDRLPPALLDAAQTAGGVLPLPAAVAYALEAIPPAAGDGV